MDKNLSQKISLPNTIPIFPLEGVVMFPDTYLPLNIFESRYLKMIDKALSSEHRLIGMIQPKKSNESYNKNVFYSVGCAGKIIKFEETDDNRYLITLKGISRFNLISENTNEKKFKEASVLWESFTKDLHYNKKQLDFSTLKITLKNYFKYKNIRANMEAINTYNDYNLVDQITMLCPLANDEKQLLLETQSITKRNSLLKTILDSHVNEANISNISKH